MRHFLSCDKQILVKGGDIIFYSYTSKKFILFFSHTFMHVSFPLPYLDSAPGIKLP
jgi:hypothetical protein